MSENEGGAASAAGFGQIEAFAQLDEEALAALREAAEVQSVEGGRRLVRYGEVADNLYLVATGRFLVRLQDGRIVAEIETGEPIGELAFFAGGPRTADIIAARDSTVFALSRAAYEEVSSKHRTITDSILAEIARRLARTTASSAAMESRPGRVVALLPAGGSVLPAQLTRMMEEALSRYSELIFVSEEDMPDGLDPESGAFGQWIAELERQHERIVLCAGDSEAWNRAIARNADDLVLTAPLSDGDAGGDGTVSDFEKEASELFLPKSRTLLVWRENTAQEIIGTGRWIDRRELHLHHHIAFDDPSSFSRVARFMNGRANGVVLAGGGALGCAHLGVLQAMLDSGIPVDFFGGTSSGGAVAGAVARGTGIQDTLEQMQDMFITQKAMKKLTIPVHSLLDPRVFDENLRMRYGEKDICDLPFNYFAVSTNLSTNAIHVHRRGPLWEAVRASGSLPAILPPIITGDGEVLVDGGVLDNIPVNVMRDVKAGPNVVVALRPDAGAAWRIKATYDDVRSPGQLARDIIMRRKHDVQIPSLVETMSRSMVVGSQASVERSLAKADVLLTPPIPQDMQLLDWHLGQEVAEVARQFTLKEIETRDDLRAMKAD